MIHKKDITPQEHKALALWAADCAEHVLKHFEKEFPNDKRPRKAIKECRKWARTGVFHMKDVRRASLDAHAAARNADEGSAARFAARAAGQAVATAHAPGHALGAAYYAVKIAGDKERAWQRRKLPRKLRKLVSLK
jgi:hypothetical protein